MIKRSDTCAKQGSDVRYFHAKNYFSWEGGGNRTIGIYRFSIGMYFPSHNTNGQWYVVK